MDEAEHCHRLAFIQRGNIIARGSPQSIKENMMRGQVLEIAPSDPEKAMNILRAKQESGDLALQAVELYGSLIHVTVADVQVSESAIRKELREADIDPGAITVIEPSLEDVFIASMR
jgi:ABC-2 type transport system ATP-binding protein